MKFTPFTDLLGALGKVASAESHIDLPKTERETIRRTLDETYRLIDTTLNTVIIWLGGIAQRGSPQDAIKEVLEVKGNRVRRRRKGRPTKT